MKSQEAGPHPVRVALRGALAGAATDLLLTAALIGLWRGLHDAWPPPLALGYAAVVGAMAGLAFGVAEAARRRAGLALAALAGLLVAATAPVAGEYLLLLLATGDSAEATQEVLDRARDLGPQVALFVSGAACLGLPLLVARGPLWREAAAVTGGLLAWLVGLELAGELREAGLNLSMYLLLLLPRALVFPLGLRGVDRGLLVLARHVRGEPAAAPSPARRATATPSAVERHRARFHDDRALARAAEGRHAEAAAEWALAQALWPTPERALSIAGAHATLLAVEPALSALEEALAIAGGRPAALDLGAAGWEPLRGHARFEALSSTPPAAGGPRGPRTPWRALALGGSTAALALAAALPLALTPAEPACLTRRRLQAALGRDGQAWLDLGRRLEALADGGGGVVVAGAWTPGALSRLGLLAPDPAEDAADGALACYLRAAGLGLPEGMLQAAELLSCYPERYAESVAWWRRAAEAGDPQAMWRWGTLLRGGWFGLRPDDEAGRGWWERAAEAGHAEAMADLARWHALRPGGAAAARRWYRRALEAGHPTAEQELAGLNGPGR